MERGGSWAAGTESSVHLFLKVTSLYSVRGASRENRSGGEGREPSWREPRANVKFVTISRKTIGGGAHLSRGARMRQVKGEDQEGEECCSRFGKKGGTVECGR